MIQALNRKGKQCPFKPTLCQEGFCRDCQIYLDYQKENSKTVGLWNKNHEICLRCGASRTSLRDMIEEGSKGNLTIVNHMLENCPACALALGDIK